jgi:hypothetical protein
MILEFWMALGGSILLGGAWIARLLQLWRPHTMWRVLAPILEAVAGLVLAIVLGLSISRQGSWGPDSLRQVSWGLALATLIVHLAFTWLIRVPGAALLVDLIILVLALIGTFALPTSATRLDCTQVATVATLTWTLLLLGAGASAVAASAALVLPLRPALIRLHIDRQRPGGESLQLLLAQATSLALLALGAGLALAVWWSWRAVGMLAGNDARHGWLAIAWLLLVMSSLAWRLSSRPLRWAASLAVLASVTASASLLLIPMLGSI